MKLPWHDGAAEGPHTDGAGSRPDRRHILWQQAWPFLVLGLLAAGWFCLTLGAVPRFLRTHVFWVFALLPSLLALGYRMLGGRRSIRARVEMVKHYRVYAERYAAQRAGGKTPLLSTAGLGDEELEQQQPRTAQFLLGTVALAVPFLMVAVLSDGPHGLGTYALGMEPDKVPGGDAQEGLRGLVFAGYGVFVYTLSLLIYRMNAAALSSEFLIGSALRAIITLVLGFTAGVVDVFAFATQPQTLFLYFVIGAFPSWALEALRRRVKALFKPNAPGEERLSLEFVDGITDQVAERLDELGISDIQHLATSEPGELSLRTLYPMTRIMDWMDQAILIGYLREKIVVARQVGIHGAIDMQLAYRDAHLPPARGRPVEPPPVDGGAITPGTILDPGRRARAMLSELATRSGLGLPAVYGIGAKLAEDYTVDFLTHLWLRQGLSSGPRRALIEAIGRALEASGVPAPGEPGHEGIPDCAWDAARTERPDFQQKLRAHLDAELERMSLSWTGSFEDLRGQCRYVDFYEALMEHIELKPLEAPRGRPPPLMGGHLGPPLHH